jgi:hypothetical protein
VKEPALLVAVQGIIGRVEIENDLPRRRLVRLEEESHEQAFDRNRIMLDLVVTGRRQRRPSGLGMYWRLDGFAR